MGRKSGLHKNSRYVLTLVFAILGLGTFGCSATPDQPNESFQIQAVDAGGTPIPGNFILWQSDCAHDRWEVVVVRLPGGGNRVTCRLASPVPSPTLTRTPTVTSTPSPTATPTVTVTPTAAAALM